MRLTLVIDLDNAAFDDAPMSELARILRDIAQEAEERGLNRFERVRDANGNRIGELTISDEAAK